MIEVCKHCGISFRCKPCQKRKFCSIPCFSAYNFPISERTHSCSVCGHKFIRTTSHVRRVGKAVCSRECQAVAQSGVNNWQWRGGKLKKECTICGAVFYVIPADSHLECCSNKCRGVRLRGPRVERIVKYCLQCGRAMVLTPGVATLKVYCGKRCKDTAHSVAMRGEGNGRFVHGEWNSKYAPSFQRKSLRREIKTRDEYRCRLCGRMERLHIHHIDYDKQNSSINNLITLCVYCHGRMHGGKEQRLWWQQKLSAVLAGESVVSDEFSTCEQDSITTLPMAS